MAPSDSEADTGIAEDRIADKQNSARTGSTDSSSAHANETSVTPEDGLSIPRRRAVRRTLRAEISFAILLAIYAVLAVLAHYFAYFSWDLQAERAIQSIEVPGFETLMFLISALGSGWEPFGLVLMAGLALLMAHRRVEALVCVIGSAAGSGVDTLL